MNNRSLTERKSSLLCRRYVTPGTDEAGISFGNVALFFRLEIDERTWLVAPKRKFWRWCLILWVFKFPRTLGCKSCLRPHKNIVQLRRGQKRRRPWQERCKKKMLWSVVSYLFHWLWKGLLVGLPRARWDLQRAKTSLCILFWLGSTNLQLLYLHSLVISIVGTCTNSWRLSPTFFDTEEVGNHWVSCRRRKQEDMGRWEIACLRSFDDVRSSEPKTGNPRMCGSPCRMKTARLTCK